MGPRLISRGNVVAVIPADGANQVLQRGHGCPAVEIHAHNLGRLPSRATSMVPRLLSRGNATIKGLRMVGNEVLQWGHG